MLITAEAGGSNGARVRLWKWERQRLATRTGLAIIVCHLPPGTSKWNKIEHRLFSYITTTWRGQPLVSLAVIVNLIGATRTAPGLRVRCELDRGTYPKGQTVSDAQMAGLTLAPPRFHGDWNSTIHPMRRRRYFGHLFSDEALGLKQMGMRKHKVISTLVCSVLVAGCATPMQQTDAPMITYDRDTEYSVASRADGFAITIYYSRFQFIPER